MPKFQVELRKWVEFSTLVEVDAPSPSRAGAIALATIEDYKPEDKPEWQRTGMIRKPVVVAMSKLTPLIEANSQIASGQASGGFGA